jgi:DNA-binding winged helix-turn-helix (wHTH) protein/tetratricopeptide (TPR) repeat protein
MPSMSMKRVGIFRFGEFQIDAGSRTLLREEKIVTLSFRAFDVLLYLVQNPGKVLTRDELLKNVWPDSYVDENSLAQSISMLRRALDEKPGDNTYIVTLTGRGYQFVAPVQVVVPHNMSVVADAATPANPGPSGLLFQRQTVRTSIITTEEKDPQSSLASRNRPLKRLVAVSAVAVTLVLTLAILGGAWLWHSNRTPKLTGKDTVVLADFSNTTGDAVFDDTLKTALDISLRQSPFLNVLSDSEVTKTLQQMTRPADTKLTREVTRELCLRAGKKADIEGSIASLGSQYVLGLKAANCQTGDTLAEEQATAASKEKVLDVLGKEASKLRTELGESLATVQRFDVPLAQATTSSLEALKAYSLGRNATRERDPAAALPYDQHAIELDPNFAMGYFAVGIDYFSLNQPGRAGEYYTKAFHLREHVSEREKLAISGWYYLNVTGQLDEAAQIFQQEIESYPLKAGEYVTLGVLLSAQGQYEKAAEAARQAARLAPDWVGGYENLANDVLALQRLDETQRVIREAQARKLDGYLLHIHLCALAFLGGDPVAMADQQRWLASKQEYEHFGLAFASDTEAYAGHVSKARELTKRAVDSAKRADNKETGALWQANAALQQAAYGNPAEARQAAAEALKLAPASQGVDVEAALAFAMAGDAARAESMAQDLGKRFPLDTQMHSLWLPAIQAQLALSKGDLAPARSALQAAAPIELGNIPFGNNISCLYHVYVRGEAYLAAGQGNAAAAEFQKILDHSGIVWNCWTGVLAHLGVARANALQAQTSQGPDADAARARAVTAYQDFFALWKDADRDIPILTHAKAEYAKLQ